jgi:hypothetical protein
LLYCTHCKKTFSERQGTVFFNSRLPDETIVSIHEHVAEGNGIGTSMERRRFLVCTVTMFVGRYGHYGDPMDAWENAVRQWLPDSLITSGR